MKSNSRTIIHDMGIYQVRNGFRKIERIPREGELKKSKQFIEYDVWRIRHLNSFYVQSYVNFAISGNWASCGRKNVT